MGHSTESSAQEGLLRLIWEMGLAKESELLYNLMVRSLFQELPKPQPVWISPLCATQPMERSIPDSARVVSSPLISVAGWILARDW